MLLNNLDQSGQKIQELLSSLDLTQYQRKLQPLVEQMFPPMSHPKKTESEILMNLEYINI